MDEQLPVLPPGFVYVPVVTTYLEMRRPAASSVDGIASTAPAAATARDGFEIRRWMNPPLDEYRAMFQHVGGPWGWSGRLLLTDDQLRTILGDPGIEVWPLYDLSAESAPAGAAEHSPQIAGFIELDSRVPGEVEIAYFGLRPEYIGRGLGGLVLRWAARNVWSRPDVNRFWLHTCDYDHAHALRIYQKAGFEIYDRHAGPEAYPADHIAMLAR